MEFDIYNCPLEDTLNITVDRLYFLNKMKIEEVIDLSDFFHYKKSSENSMEVPINPLRSNDSSL